MGIEPKIQLKSHRYSILRPTPVPMSALRASISETSLVPLINEQ